LHHRSQSHEIGDRYVLQYAGGVERLALAQRGVGDERATTLHPIEPEHPLPPQALLAGEWLIGPRDRVVPDWHGRYWCVSSRAIHGHGARWRINFERYTTDGQALRFTAETQHEPAVLADAELMDVLRRAWDPRQDA
jgi:hypothetical protein